MLLAITYVETINLIRQIESIYEGLKLFIEYNYKKDCYLISINYAGFNVALEIANDFKCDIFTISNSLIAPTIRLIEEQIETELEEP